MSEVVNSIGFTDAQLEKIGIYAAREANRLNVIIPVLAPAPAPTPALAIVTPNNDLSSVWNLPISAWEGRLLSRLLLSNQVLIMLPFLGEYNADSTEEDFSALATELALLQTIHLKGVKYTKPPTVPKRKLLLLLFRWISGYSNPHY